MSSILIKKFHELAKPNKLQFLALYFKKTRTIWEELLPHYPELAHLLKNKYDDFSLFLSIDLKPALRKSQTLLRLYNKPFLHKKAASLPQLYSKKDRDVRLTNAIFIPPDQEETPPPLPPESPTLEPLSAPKMIEEKPRALSSLSSKKVDVQAIQLFSRPRSKSLVEIDSLRGVGEFFAFRLGITERKKN